MLYTTPTGYSERGGNFILKNPTTFKMLDSYLRAGITRRDSDQSTMTSACQYSAKDLHQLAGSALGKPVSRPLWHALTTNGISRVQPQTRRVQRGGTHLCKPIAVQTDCSDGVCLQTQPLCQLYDCLPHGLVTGHWFKYAP